MTEKTYPAKAPDDLGRFQPASFDEIVGNHELKESLQDLIYEVRVRGHKSGFNMIATGPSRDGKTAAIILAAKALLCCNLKIETMALCDDADNTASQEVSDGQPLNNNEKPNCDAGDDDLEPNFASINQSSKREKMTQIIHPPEVPDDLERFSPSSFEEIVGNDELKEFCQDMIYCVRVKGHKSGFNMMTNGPSRDGKTATINLAIKALLCCNLNMETMRPCGVCENCTSKHYLNGTGEWNNIVDFSDNPELNPMPIRFHYFPIDCAHLDSEGIDDLILNIRIDDGNLKIVYLDEFHKLARREMDEKLLIPTEKYPVIWLASSAVIEKEHQDDKKKVDKMFQNRFSFRIKTQRPDSKKLLSWLIARCQQFEIKVEKAEKTLPRLVERSNRSPGMALQVLNKAHKKRKPLLTMKMVEEHIFDFDD